MLANKHPQSRTNRFFRLLKKIVFISGIILSIAIILIIAIFNYSLPDISQLKKASLAESTQILDREGNLLYTIHGEENREYTEIKGISSHLVDATIAVEDQNFYHHKGYDFFGILRAVYKNTFNIGGNREGASTITQQLIKNTLLTPEKTYIRKVKELILSIKLENNFSKDEILELYLNKIPYGNNAYGVQKAAKVYFNTDSDKLSIAEAATLAALPNAPSFYSPFGNNKFSRLLTKIPRSEIEKRDIKAASDLEQNEYVRGLLGTLVNLTEEKTMYLPGRVDIVLSAMEKMELINSEEKKIALIETQKEDFFKRGYRAKIKYPHFVLWVREQLEEKYGKETVEIGGLKVTTTIDPKLQDAAEQIVEKYVELNKERFNAHNASLVSMNPETGEILAMVGSADFFNDEIDGQVNMAISLKQPGSSFKPFSYAAAFLNRYTPATIVYDVETELGDKTPKNYDGEFRGPVSLRKALAQSRNIPAIKTYFLGGRTKKIVELASAMGISTLNINGDYGWTLALGTAEVKLIDMVRSYSTFAKNGVRPDIQPIIEVKDQKGKILEEIDKTPNYPTILDPQVAYLITNILSDKSVSIGSNMQVTGHPSAAKTGTSTKMVPDIEEPIASNLWTVGYTQNLVTGVWVGNANDKKTGNLKGLANGYDGAGPIWKEFMTQALEEVPPMPFEVPEGIKRIKVSKKTGLLPGSKTKESNITEEVFASFAVPIETESNFETHTIEGYTNTLWQEGCSTTFKEDALYQLHKSVDPMYDYLFQEGINKWTEENGKAIPPTEKCTVSSPNNMPSISFTEDSKFEFISPGKTSIQVNANAPNGVGTIEFYVNDKLHGTTTERPFKTDLKIIPYIGDTGSNHLIRARIIDKYGYSRDIMQQVTLVK